MNTTKYKIIAQMTYGFVGTVFNRSVNLTYPVDCEHVTTANELFEDCKGIKSACFEAGDAQFRAKVGLVKSPFTPEQLTDLARLGNIISYSVIVVPLTDN